MFETLKKFDLDNYELSTFFCDVAISIDRHRKKEADLEDYELINRSAKILRDQSRKYRESKETNELRLIDDNLLFFNKMYPNSKVKTTQEARKNIAKKLINLSEDLNCVENLPDKKLLDLEETCVKLSKVTMEEWHNRNYGFIKYAT